MTLAVATLVVLAACNRGESDRAAVDGPAAPAVSGPAEAAPSRSHVMGEKVALRNGDTVQVIAYTADVTSEDLLTGPGAGMQFAAIDVEGCSKEDTSAGSVSPSSFELAMGAVSRLQPAFPVKEPQLSSGPRLAGDCIRGWVTFEVPAGDTPTAVVFDDSGTPIVWDLA